MVVKCVVEVVGRGIVWQCMLVVIGKGGIVRWWKLVGIGRGVILVVSAGSSCYMYIHGGSFR